MIANSILEKVEKANALAEEAKRLTKEAEILLLDDEEMRVFYDKTKNSNDFDSMFELAHKVKVGRVARLLYESGYRVQDEKGVE